MGGEFSYECLGFTGNDPNSGSMRYQITINMYRDCIGGGAWFDGDQAEAARRMLGGSPGHISIYLGERYVERNFPIDLQRFSDVPINLGNPCLVINDDICQQIGIYTFPIDLPISDETYTLTYQRCCRNETIRNILSPADIGTTYFIRITPEAQQRCNSSPVFNIDPPIAICINQPFQIDLGATDKDGDSLVYKFCDPVLGGGQDGLGGRFQTATTFDDIVPEGESPFPYSSISWRLPLYGTANQLGNGSTLTLDPNTGLLAGVPIYPGNHVLGVCVEEWSRDSVPILLSETKREFQLNVSRCANAVFADLLETEIDEQGRFFIRQCGPGPNTIINESTEERVITRYDWELTGPGDEVFTGRSRDFDTNIREVGVYQGIMILNSDSFAENCKDTAEFLLGVFPETNADFEFTEVICDPEPIVFTDLSTVDGDQQIVNYQWDFADGSQPNGAANPNYQYQVPGRFPVSLTVTDNNGCGDEMVKDVDYFPAPRTLLVEPDESFGCIPFDKQFINRSTPIDDTYTFEWEFGDGAMADTRDPAHTYEEAGVYDVYLGITSPLGCFVDTTFRRLIDVRESPEADFVFSPERVTNIVPDFTVLDRSRGANSLSYEVRDRAGNALFSSPGPDFDFRLRDTSTVFVTQFVTHPSGCRDTLTKDVRLFLKNTFHAPNAFTPNGDGLNDVWQPVGIFAGASEYQLRIWTRWGELIFSTDNFEEGWNGTFKGADSPAGGYLWDVTFINAEGDPEALKGGLVLVR